MHLDNLVSLFLFFQENLTPPWCFLSSFSDFSFGSEIIIPRQELVNQHIHLPSLAVVAKVRKKNTFCIKKGLGWSCCFQGLLQDLHDIFLHRSKHCPKRVVSDFCGQGVRLLDPSLLPQPEAGTQPLPVGCQPWGSRQVPRAGATRPSAVPSPDPGQIAQGTGPQAPEHPRATELEVFLLVPSLQGGFYPVSRDRDAPRNWSLLPPSQPLQRCPQRRVHRTRSLPDGGLGVPV